MFQRFALLLHIILVCTVAHADDEATEPPLRYQLEIDGKLYPISESEPQKLSGTFTDPMVKIVVDPYREFHHGGVKFLYPRSYTFEAETDDPEVSIWTLSGNDLTIMYFVSAGTLTVDEYAKSMIAELNAVDCRSVPTKVEIAGKMLNGRHLDMKLVGTRITMDVYQLRSKRNKQLLVFQDLPTEDGAPSAEAQSVLPIILKSFSQQ